VNVFLKLLAKRLIDPGVDGSAVLHYMVVVTPKGILGKVAENLGDAKVWNVEKVARPLRAD
jgi:hypothetical protein